MSRPISESLSLLNETLGNCKTNLKEKEVADVDNIKISDVDEKIAEIQSGSSDSLLEDLLDLYVGVDNYDGLYINDQKIKWGGYTPVDIIGDSLEFQLRGKVDYTFDGANTELFMIHPDTKETIQVNGNTTVDGQYTSEKTLAFSIKKENLNLLGRKHNTRPYTVLIRCDSSILYIGSLTFPNEPA